MSPSGAPNSTRQKASIARNVTTKRIPYRTRAVLRSLTASATCLNQPVPTPQAKKSPPGVFFTLPAADVAKRSSARAAAPSLLAPKTESLLSAPELPSSPMDATTLSHPMLDQPAEATNRRGS